ncbi:MAG: amino acid adenylation domain-containing protein [Roseivirga sp.]|nr:amino acid adenylation domain-containing protein [Roseivirga sp.]
MTEKIEKSNVDGIFELSMVQKGMLFHYLKEDQGNLYNVQLSFKIEGDLDVDLFKKAFEKVQSGNEVLRSVFRWDKISKPIQIVLKDCPVDFTYHDLVQEKTEASSEFVEQFLIDDRNQRFDLTKLVLRLNLIKTEAQSYLFVITHHHILYDGWSTGILLKELFVGYQQLAVGQEPGLTTKPSYEIVKTALKKEVTDTVDASYWENYLSGHEESASLPEENPKKGSQVNVEKFRLTHPLDELETFARTHKVTKAAVLYAAYGLLLQKHNDASDVTFGTTVSNRNSRVKGMGQFMGNFITSIPLRLRNQEGSTLLEVVKGLNQELIERNPYHHSSLYEINQALGLKSGEALFDTTLGIENYPLDEGLLNAIDGLSIALNSVYENTHVSLAVTAIFRDSLELEFNYKQNVLSAGFVASMAHHYCTILNQITSQPDQKVEALDLLSEKESHQLLHEFNNTETDYPSEKSYIDLFEDQVEETPDACALAYGESRVTYRELNQRSNALSLRLKAAAGDDVLAALYVHPSIEMVVSILAIWKGGLAYLPLDPNQPKARLQAMLEDSQCQLLLTTTADENELSFAGQKLLIDENDSDDVNEMPPLQRSPDQLAYVIYTSGSTGKPKGVKIKHGNLVNYVSWIKKELELGATDKAILTLNYAFDAGYTTLFPALVCGGEIHLIPRSLIYSAEGLVDYVSQQGISFMKLTPSLFKAFIGAGNFGTVHLDGLKHVLLGGEAIMAADVEKAASLYPHIGFINHYGPSETTIGCITHPIDMGEFDHFKNRPVIGKPIHNSQAYVLDRHGKPLPIGSKGELYIGGAGVGLGYLGNQKLTDERFLDNPFVPGGRMYRTGDMARWLANGTVEFLGRTDEQVKVRGYRIELKEIQKPLAAYDAIEEAVVVTRIKDDERYLVAYYQAKSAVEATVLRAYLLTKLPAYMVPTQFVHLEEIPLTVNGKVDKKQLPGPEIKPPAARLTTANQTEEILLNIWAEVLGHDSISTDQNFFDAGGDSLKMITMSSKISKFFKKEVSVTNLFAHPTITELARLVGPEEVATNRATRKMKTKSQNNGKSANESNDIAVVGIAGRFPGAANVGELWENLKAGVDSVQREIKETEQGGIIKAKGILEGNDMFEASFFNYTPDEANLMDPQMRIFHECSWEALEDAGYDPFQYEGAIGLYGGASVNPFYTPAIGQDNHETWMENWQSHIYSTHDYLCSRVSYKLNLRGPSVNIATACSTSLVAIDAACRDLQDDRCDMALSGGVSLTFHDTEGYKYKKDMILSPDGYCRAFDKGAAGTVGGNGVGIVVLKRLKEALRDGDNIHAVIKGSAVNNDGIQKVGFTAPSITGQAEVIQSAIHNANIDPESISYVEAHGTGTLLGDPIEMEGLKRAFDSKKENFCAIGSVKTNFGHLNAAAGVTGFIKTVLSLKNKQIPPSLHFESPNEALGIENSPFYVNNKLKDWQRNGTPRRAGVSSFGIGGTNAHIILEEAPERIKVSESRDYQLMVLSAKTQAALDRNMANLKLHLEAHSDESLEDIAYTLNQGRAHFDYRKSIVFENREQAIDQLSKRDGANQKGPARHFEDQTIAFMFPGQGAQYLNMLRDLYDGEAAFREMVDECFDLVKSVAGKDLKPIVFGDPDPDGENLINHTEFTQPLLFIMEYALARLLIKWGIQPDVMIGHSIGEYAAACISGVFSLKDALTLVVKRGELMQKLPTGSMLSLTMTEEELKPFLAEAPTLSLAVSNSTKSCVVSGPHEAIDFFQKRMEMEGHKGKRVQCSHAFHSAMMDGMLGEFTAVVDAMDLQKPQIPFISNLTGVEAEAEEVTTASYWAQHLRGTVRFSQGIETLMANKKTLFIESGPGGILSSLVHANKEKGTGHHTVNLARHPKDQKNDWQFLLSALGELYLKGGIIDWQAFYAHESRLKVSLPTYAFEKIQYPVKTQALVSPQATQQPLVRIDDVAEWFYVPSWKMLPLFANESATKPGATNLIFMDGASLGQSLINHFESKGDKVIQVSKGAAFKANSDTTYQLNPEKEGNMKALFEHLAEQGVTVDRIIYGWSVGMQEEANNSFCHLVELVQAVTANTASLNMQLVLLTNDLQSVLGHENLDIAQSTSTALLKVIGQEYPGITTSQIDVMQSESNNKGLIDALYQEIAHQQAGKTVAYRNSRRWVQVFEQLSTELCDNSSLLRKKGVYLITGGLGDLGYHLSKYLLKTTEARLILTGRRTLGGNDEAKSKKLSELQSLGQVIYIASDVTDLEAMRQAVAQGEEHLGALNGVIHAAGMVGEDSKDFIKNLNRKVIDTQLASKVTGTAVLQEVLGKRALDFCILTSSISTILGGLGFAAYASANAYMDHFAQASGENWLSVNFDGLNLVGGTGEGIDAEEIITVFHQLWSFLPLPQVAVSVADLNERLNTWVYQAEAAGAMERSPKAAVTQEAAPAAVVADSELSMEDALLALWQNFFGTSEIFPDDSFFAIGGDSLKALSMIDRIQNQFGAALSVEQLFANPTISELLLLITPAIEEVTIEPVVEEVSTSIPKAPVKDIYPLSSVQQRLYFLNEFDQDLLAYNMPMVLTLEGTLDPARLKSAFNALGERHESLRTFFDVVEGTPAQRILAGIDFKIEHYEATEAEVKSVITDFIRPFDLSRAPLMRIGLIQTAPEAHTLMVDMHHLINDGVSRDVLVRDFMALYNGEALCPLQLQYKDYAEWQQSEGLQEEISKQKDFWLDQFAEQVETLQLPLDFARPAIKSQVGDHVQFDLSPELTQQLKAIANTEGATMFMVLLSIYNILLSKLSLQDDIVVGTSTAGRHQQALEDIIGMFVKTIPLRNRPEGELTFTEFLKNVRTQVIRCFDNQSYPYEDLIGALNIERDTSHNPLFDVLFSYENFSKTDLSLPGLSLKPYDFKHTDAKFDLTLTAGEKEDGSLYLGLNYSVGLFKKPTVERFARYFENIVKGVTANAEVRLKDIEVLTDEERNLLLSKFNVTALDYADKDTLVSLFEKQVEATPERVAVVFEGQRLTYASLNEKANLLAGNLRKAYDIRPNDVVGIMVRRSEMMMTGLIGILKSGAAYLPIDPDHPKQRIQHVLEDSHAGILITEAGLEQGLDFDGQVIYLESELDQSVGNTNQKPVNRPEDLCYLIYTSGSTGKPKGVMISHQNVMNFFCGMSDKIPATEEDCLLAVTNTSFDISVLELFWTLTQGIEVVIHPSGTSLNNLDRYVSNQDVSMDFGLFFFSSYKNEGDDKYDLLLEATRYADEAGFSAVWTPERHFHEFGGLFPNPSVLSSALAMVTEQVELRSGSVVLALHDEIRVVEEWSVVDNLSNGRVALSFAAGWNPNDFVLKDANFAERHQVMFEKIEEVQKLWKGGSIERENGFGKTIELSAFPVPVRPELPIWVTSGGGEETFKSAGEVGANVLTHLLGQDIDELARKIRLYREAREAHGFDPKEGKVALMLHTYVGEDIEEVERIVEQPFIEYLESSFALNKAIFEEEGVKEEELSEEVKAQIMKNAFKRYYKTSALIGTKNSCSEMVLKLKQVGVDEIACLVDFGVEQKLMMEGLKHLKGLKELHAEVTIEHHKPITMMQSTPSFMGHLNKDLGSQAFLRSLKTLMIGGEALPMSLVQELRETTEAGIFNMYGPTESTIWSCVYEFAGDEDKVSIGKPIANTQIYVLDRARQLVPIGVAGDLYIGGKGLSGEYWKRPELTAKVFVDNPFIDGEKIYRTGDSARWSADGTLEFIGRTDYQVKLKGYRIELGEIEHILLEYPGITEAIVVVKGEQENESLVGYLVTKAVVDFTELRSHAGQKLPHYMIPTDFIVLDKMPLTPNGKVNRKALPEPVATTRDQYEAPQTEKERLLVEVWSKVLDVEHVGVTDNFFAVGGDSIKSIQIISRVRNAGYEVSAKDIFISQTIRQLATRLREITLTSDQSTLTGQGALSPIQLWYFDRASVDVHHYNHAVMLHFPKGISEDFVRRIFEKLQEHHDALRTVFHRQGEELLSEIKGVDLPVSLATYYLEEDSDSQAAILTHANEIQASIDLQGGPLMKLGLFHTQEGSRLLIVIHHLVIDGISWRILFEDIEQAHQQLIHKKPLVLPLKTDAFQAWPGHLQAYMGTTAYEEALQYWSALSAQEFDLIKRDRISGENIGEHSRLETITIDPEATQKLLTEVHEAFGTQINDLLLAALLLAFNKKLGLQKVMVDIEGHGREDLGTGVNISRTIGWFTSIFRLLLDGDTEDLARYIKQIKEKIREIPNNGIDFLLARFFDQEGRETTDGPESRPQLSFNYLGQFNADTKGNTFELLDEPVGDMVSSRATLLYDWDITGLVIEDELEIRLRYSADQYDAETIKSFLAEYKASLETLINFCSSYGKAELTPSDIIYPGLSIDQLDGLQQQFEVENVYPLSPMQEAMLFHALMDPNSAHYFEQLTFDFKGDLDIAKMEESVNELIRRYDIFRTLFLHQDHEYPLQVVLKDRKVDFINKDLRAACQKQSREAVVARFKQEDLDHKFDLSKDIMMRLTLLRTADDEYTLIWSYHHIVMDGWCVPIIFNEFKEIYAGLRQGTEATLPVVKPFSTYISWLQQREEQEALDYWQRYLSDYDSLATLPVKTTLPQTGERPYDLKSMGLDLDPDIVASLNDISKTHGVTVNTIIQLAWSVLLSRYNNVDDVVFGAVVSGRPSEIEGIDSMVGMFINTVPVRVNFEQEEKVSDVLKRVQEEVMTGTPYHYSPLVKIQSLNDLGADLLNHIILFDNYPFSEDEAGSEEEARNGFRVTGAGLYEQSFFDFYLVVVPRGKFHIELNYNANAFDGHVIERVRAHFAQIITQFTNDCEVPLSAIEMISEGERKEVLEVFNDTFEAFDKDKTFISLFEEQTQKSPKSVAVLHNGESFTYEALYEKAGRLSALLQSKGLKDNQKVALYMPRGIDMLTSILAVFYAGGAYVPIDVTYPGERVKEILSNSESPLVLTHQAHQEQMENLVAAIPTLETTLAVDGLALEAFVASEKAASKPDDLAYIIYTSGTTGKPKGVMIHQRGMVNHLFAKVNDLNLTAEDIVAQTASPCFDISVWQFLSALVVGGKTLVIDNDIILEPNALVNVLEKGGVTIFESVPSLITTFLDGLPSDEQKYLQDLRWMIPTGEALTMGLVKKWYAYFPQIPLLNAYGPTEASDDVTHFVVPQPKEGQSTVPIGKPVQNTQIYIVDKHLNLCPVGVKGEVCVAGLGVGKGYWKNEEKTKSAFVPNPFGGAYEGLAFDTLYKTGDVGYYQPDGNIVCLGRVDSQVKIRGFRIELEEIESHLAIHEHIEEVAVITREKSGLKFLVAYYVAAEVLETSVLREYLLARLPDYMVPSYFVHVEAMPLTANGKLNRKALPEVEGVAVDDYVAPVTAGEKLLAEVWSNVLGIEQIGVTDNFFMLGGDSIKSIQICSRARSAGFELAVQDIFSQQTISELAQQLKALQANQAPVTAAPLERNGRLTTEHLTYHGLSQGQLDKLLERYDIEDIYPLSSMQEGMLYHALIDLDAGDYFGQSTYELQGKLDLKLVEESMNELMSRYFILRTIFLHEGYSRPIQVVLQERKIDFSHHDLRKELNGSKEARLEAYRDAEKSKPFDLTADVLMRLVVLQSADDEFELIWSHHHVLMDGWCIGILVNEFTMIYSRKLQDRPVYLQPTTPYSTYIRWLENRQKEASQTYWKDYLAGIETAPTFPQKDATAEAPYVLKKQHLQFSKEETSEMETFARQHGATMNTLFQAAWGLMLARYNNADDVVFGSVVSGRPVEIEGIETMVGLFINTIPTRVNFQSEDTVNDLLQKTQQDSINSGPHHYFPLAEIQAQSELGGNLINHIIAFENFPVTRHLIDPEAKALEEAMPFKIKKSGYWVQTNYDLSLTVIPTEEFEVIFDYNQNKYGDNIIEQMRSALKHIMTAFAADADKPLTDIALFDEQSQQAQSQHLACDLTVPLDFVTIQERLARSFGENSAGTAIEYKGQSYDYAMLEARANQIAHAIVAGNLPDESNIGILCEDRYWMISAMLGVLKARKAFVPLEASLPPGRLTSMIDQTEAKLIITDQSTETRQSLKVADSIEWVTTANIESQPETAIETEKDYQADDRIYAYFTSGSTGQPKGVIGRNTGLSHFIGWEIDTYGIDNSFRISQFTNPGFDVFMRDVFVPLCAGGTLCIPDGNILELDDGIHHWISEQRINLIHCVPSLFKLIQKEGLTAASFEDLKYVLLAGEKILPWELKDWYNTFEERISLVNIYGPTETTLAKAAYVIKPEDTERSFMPLKAIAGAQMLILDEDLNLCPQGAIGEIYIRTPYRSHGYLVLPDLNEKSFIVNPFGDNQNDTLYKTGDLGRLHNDDEVEVLGRVDNQIKIRGIRIELDDIKENICQFKGVSDTVVLVKEDEEGDKLITAYMVEEEAFETSDLRAFLEETLPPNMIPSYLVTIPEFPLLPNGKINRKALPDPALEVALPEEQAANPIEAKLLDIWAEVLKVEKDQISTTKTFFEMGGHSVKVFHIINKIQQEFSVKLKLADVFKNASVKETARLIAEMGHEHIEQIPTAAQRDFYAASPAQERMYYQHLLHENSTAFNISIAVEIKEEVEVEALRSSFQTMINRHEGLRTSFALTDDGVIQRIHREVSFELEMPDQKVEDVEAAFEAFTKPFDLSAKSLIRAGLLCNTKGNFLFINLHHIVADGRSLDILINDFKKIHLGEALEPLKLRYVDYACWLNENKEKLDKQQLYWTDKLSGELTRTDLPIISEREEVDTKLVDDKELVIGDKVYEALKTVAANYKVSDFMLMLSAYYILLHKMSGESDLIIGTEVLGRTQAELKDVVGTFVNVLPLRVDANPERSYADFLSDVKECVLQAFDNQDFQFEQMVKLVSEDEESPGRNPIFDFYFSLANTIDSDAELDELKLSPVNFGKRVKGEYEFAINVVEHNQKMTMSFIYSHELYDEDTIGLLMDYYHNILTDILKDQMLRIEDIDMEGVLS